MAKVLCEDCLRSYKPYTYRETLQRAVVSDDHEWQGVDDEDHIYRRYIDYLINHISGGGLSLQQQNSKNRSTIEKIRSLFPSVDDFMLCHGKFNKERRTKISASFLCFDCEKYLCAKCITGHSEHFIFSEDDKNNVDKWDAIETKIIQAFNTEGDKKEEHIKREGAVLCNILDVRDSVSETEWEIFMLSVGKHVVDKLRSELDRVYAAWDICILNDNQTFLVIYYNSTHMKIYNNSSYVLIDTIELPDKHGRITEIPSTDPSQSLIAVSFPDEGRINIMNIQRRPAEVISSINVRDRCYDIAYCNNKLITRCFDNLYGMSSHSIHVMDMAGEIIDIIDRNNLSGIEHGWLYQCRMSVHSESEAIYACRPFNSVKCLSLTGQVLHTTRFADLVPRHICVDRDQNVYVMGYSLPLYRLSSDLSERVKIIDVDAANIGWVRSIVHHKNKIYMASGEGFVYVFNVD